MEMMGGALGAVGSIAGAFIAADAQKYSANTNWAIAIMNYYQRERERTQARFEAQRVEMKQDLGMTDIEGTKTQFVPGVGWTTTAAPQKKALMARENAEKMAQFEDARLKRQQLQANMGQQIRERDYSKALFDEMRKTTHPSVTDIKNLIFNAADTASNRAYDDALKVGSREAMRKGRDPGTIFKEIAKNRAQEQRGLSSSSLAQAMSIAPQLEDQDKKMQANLYNMFATRGSAMPDVTFAPTPIDSGATTAAMRGSGNAGELAVKAAMMEGGRLPYIPPNYGLANAIGASGMALQGLGRNMQPRQQVQFADAGAGNLWSAIGGYPDERYRGNQGAIF